MELKYGLISVDDHVQEPPDLWTSRLSQTKFGDRAPRLERKNGAEHWVLDGKELLGGHAARASALTGDRIHEPATWEQVPSEAYVPADRLRAMDAAGIDYSAL